MSRASGRGPSRAWYWAGGGIVLAGMVGAILWGALGFVGLSDQVKGFARVPIDGGGAISLAHDGAYTVYYEAPTGAESGVSSVGAVPPFEASLVSAEGQTVAVSDYGSSLTYDFGGHSGQAIGTFDVARPGRYVLESSSSGAGELAVGRGVGGRLVATVVGAMVLALGGVVVGTIVLIVTGVARHGARQRATPVPGAPWPPAGSVA